MVEGPGVHRVAIAHRRVLGGKAFSATSPSGRFTEGAAAIDGRFVSLIEAHGKNIFYFFTRKKLENATLAKLPDDVIVVHIHFGMSGSFRTFAFPGPEPREKTRLKLENKKEKLVAHLSAQLCVHGGIEVYRKRVAELGPDPLREDADKEIVWSKMQKSKKTIGGIIMDQSFIAGIGNIYRTEILFVCGVHPDQRASTLPRSTFEELWSNSVRLLKVGVATGSITTVSPEEAGKPYSKLKSGERRYVYSHETCRRCGGAVRSWTSASRTVYACEVCQPLREIEANGVDKTVGEDALEEARPPDSITSTHKNAKAARPEKTKKTSEKKTKEATATITFRKRKIMDGRIVEHQALKDIPAGGLVDFPVNLDDLTWPSANPRASNKSSSLSEAKIVQPDVILSANTDIALEQVPKLGRRSSRVLKKVQRLGVDV
ncbi:unnamed protein product [Calypogeia fissa]